MICVLRIKIKAGGIFNIYELQIKGFMMLTLLFATFRMLDKFAYFCHLLSGLYFKNITRTSVSRLGMAFGWGLI